MIDRTSSSVQDVAAANVDPWRLSRRNASDTNEDQAREACDETLFALANGALGVRGGREEMSSSTQASFIAGVWERAPIHYHERHSGFALHTDTRVPVADATAIRIFLGDLPLDSAGASRIDDERILELGAGRLSRNTHWRSARSDNIEVRAERLVSLAYPGLLCIRFRLLSIDYAGPLALHSSIFGAQQAVAQGDDPRVGAGIGLALINAGSRAGLDSASVSQHTVHSGIRVVCTQSHRVTARDICFTTADADNDSALQIYVGTIAIGEEVLLEKFVAYAWSAPQQEISFASLLEQATITRNLAREAGFDALANEQQKTFAAFWRNAELTIDADAATEQALRFNLFHIFQSAGRDGKGGIAAKGLTGEGYEGHVFWDAETFVLPALVFSAPALVRSSLEFRFRTLDRARAHAREMNHERGALYPWRTIAGDECSAHYPSGSAQYHINAAIAFALKLYIDATDDIAFLAEGGAEMLFETARLWLQVGHFNARRGGAFCIDAVTGPDEYTALVDNNYYTNRMAQEHLRYAFAVARELAAESPHVFAALSKKLSLSDSEIDEFSRAADAMYLPFDSALGIVAQDDSFLDKPQWDFAGTTPEKYPLLMHYHPLTLYRHQVCKQADALLAFVLAGDDLDRAAKRRSFDYYEKITVHDSTLSASTFAIVAAEVGYGDKAQDYFRDTLRVDLDDLHNNTGHGAHMAAMAGSWLVLSWGFGGLRSNDGRLEFDPMLPSAWRGYSFGIVWKGRRLRVSVDVQSAHYTLLDGTPLDITHAGTRMSLTAGVTQTHRLRNHTYVAPATAANPRHQFPQTFKALIFDLDGVLADTAHLHHAAWRRLSVELGLPWDETIGERLKGVDRLASLDIVLGGNAHKYTNAQKSELAQRKNGYYLASIANFSAHDLLPGAFDVLSAAREAGLKIALASASRSAGELVARLGIAQFFDHIIDSATVIRAKPDPEIFLRAASALGVAPHECMGIEDAAAGIAAIHAAGMTALGIGATPALENADALLPDLVAFKLTDFVVVAPRS